MEMLQAASHTKGAVSSLAHLGLQANEEVAKVFHFLSSSCSLSNRRGNLHRQTNPTLHWKEAAGPALPWMDGLLLREEGRSLGPEIYNRMSIPTGMEGLTGNLGWLTFSHPNREASSEPCMNVS